MLIHEKIEKKLLLGFGVIFVIAVLTVIAAVRNTVHSGNSADWVNHTHEFILEINSLHSSLNQAEAAHKTYLMSGTDSDRSIFRLAVSEVSEHLGVVKTYGQQTDSSTQSTLNELESFVTNRLELLDAVVKIRMEKGFEIARTGLNSTTARDTLEQIRKAISSLIQSQNQLLHERDVAVFRHTRYTRYILFSGLATNFILLAFLFFLIQSDLEVRRESAKLMKDYNETLEKKVKERTLELERVNTSLEVENLERRWMAEAAERQYLHNELIIQCIEAGVYVITRNGNITKLNHYGGWLAGFEPAQLVGRSIETIIPVAANEKSWKDSRLYRAMLQDESLVNVHTALLRRDGSTLPVHYNSRSMRAEGKVVGAVVTVFGPVS